MEVDTANNAATNCCNNKNKTNPSNLVVYVSNTTTQPNVTYYNTYPNHHQTTLNNDYYNTNNKPIINNNNNINNNKKSTINLFEPYFQNLYDCSNNTSIINNTNNKQDITEQHQGYVATVTVANTSPIGNVSSSSYFSSPMTPRSTSRCDSVHSSCSSTDSGVEIVHHNSTPPHLIHLPHGSPQNLSPHSTQQQQQQQHQLQQQQVITDISVPLGWRRLLVNNTIVYISPSGIELSSRETTRQYLVTPGTCKCGLECPLHFDTVFSFDPKIVNRAWPPRSEEPPRLCNHKRKCMQSGARTSPAPLLTPDLAKDISAARRQRRRKVAPYDGMSVSQLLAHRELQNNQQQQQQQHQHKEPMPMPPTTRINQNAWPPQQFTPQLRPQQCAPLPPQFRPTTTQMSTMETPTTMYNTAGQYPQRLPYYPPGYPNFGQHTWNYEKEIPLHQLSWDDVSKRKKSKNKRIKLSRESPCPNIDIRQIPTTDINNRQQFIQSTDPNIPSFMEDPNAFLAQQTALLNSTILRQTAVNSQQQQQQQQRPPSSLESSSPTSSPCSVANILPYSTTMSTPTPQIHTSMSNMMPYSIPTTASTPQPPSSIPTMMSYSTSMQISPTSNSSHIPMPSLVPFSAPMQISPSSHSSTSSPIPTPNLMSYSTTMQMNPSIPSTSTPQAPTSIQNMLPYSNTIQMSLSNDISMQNTINTFVSTPNIPRSNPSQVPSNIVPLPSNISLPKGMNRVTHNTVYQATSSSFTQHMSQIPDSASECQACSMNAALQYHAVKDTLSPEENPVTSSTLQDKTSPIPEIRGPIQGGTISTSEAMSPTSTQQPEVTTMASGHTPSSNTITSVVAGRTSTVTVSNLSPPTVTTTFPSSISKSPLEMVQSVVSSIQVPQQQQQQQQQQTRIINDNNSQQQMIDQNPLLKTNLQQGHILVSSNGQLIIQQPQKLNQPTNTNNSQMINMGQPLVQLVNTLPCNTPLLLNHGMLPQTLVEGTPLHLTLSGNMLHQSPPEERTIVTNTDLLSGGHKKKGKKRKICQPPVTSMLQLHNSPIIMQNFPTIQTQQQPPMLQAVTILPGNKPQFLQFPTNSAQQQNSQPSPNQQFSNFLSPPQNSINLIQPLNLGSFMPNFPLLQGGTTLVVPNLQGLQSMVMADGTIVSQQQDPGTVQLQIQNVNGQQVLTQVQSQNMFGSPTQNLIATPGMVIRTPAPQTQVISNKITTGQVISQNGHLISPQTQFLVNGAFTQQTALNGLVVNPGQHQVTLAPQNTSPNQNRQQDFIQCMNVNGQLPMIIPCSGNQTVPTSSNANATLLQQNTTIVQQQTTLQVANNQHNSNIVNSPNFLLNKSFQELTAPLLLQKHSVSTQTAAGQTLMIQASPETITVAADTTTASPMSEAASQVDCGVSSTDTWTDEMQRVESSIKMEESKQCRRKNSDLLVIAQAVASPEMEDTATTPSSPRNLVVGDLVWGPARGFPSWPGKLVQMESSTPSSPSTALVKWFGDIIPTSSQVEVNLLKTLSEGLEAHHRATKKFRKGRRMNSQLEQAIQEAMLELDQQATENNNEKR